MLELKGDDIQALARAVFGPKCRVLAWHPVDHRDDALVVFATLVFPARVVVVKLADGGATAPSLAREAAIQRRVADETSVPVCEVLAADDSCQRFPWRYLLMAHAPGMEWRDGLARMSSDARYSIFHQLGEATAALHRLRYPHFGEIEERSANLTPQPLLPPGKGEPEPSPLGSMVARSLPAPGRVAKGREGSGDFLEALTARARRRIANPAHADLFIATLQARASDFAGITAPWLTHEDLNPSNLLLVPGENEDDDWRLAALLDFGSAWAGCPESDLARLDLWRDMMGDGFRAGYTALQPIAEDYPSRRPIFQLLWCLEYARPTAQHHADTARVCAELGIPAVRFGSDQVDRQ